MPLTARAARRARDTVGAAPQRDGRRSGERPLVLVSGLAAAIPVLVAAVHQLRIDWVPLGDDAIIAIRAFDVLTSDPPLLGMPAGGATGVLHEQAYHLGPLLFWLLAVPSRFLHTSLMPVAVGLLNVACVVGVVALGHRRGGRPLMVATAIGVALMLASIPSTAYSAVWNPAAGLMPFTLLLFAAWSVACGEHRMLPVAVVAASFAAQCHLTYVVPSLVALVVAGAGLAFSWRGRPGAARGAAAWVALAALVAVVCWCPAAIQQVRDEPGNLTVLRRAGTSSDAKLGSRVASRAVAHGVGAAPWWLRSPRGPLQRIADVSAPLGALRVASALVVLAGLAGVALAGARRRRPDVAAAGILGLSLCAALWVAVSSVPRTAFATIGYSLWWASAVGLFAWLALGWSIATLAASRFRIRATARRTLGAFAVVAAVAVVGVLVAARSDGRDEPVEQMRTVATRLRAALPPRAAVAVTASPPDVFTAAGFQLGIVYALRRDGWDVVAPSVARYLGSRYQDDPGSRRTEVVVDVNRSPSRGSRVIARVSFDARDPDNPFVTGPQIRRVTVSLAPSRRGRRAATRAARSGYLHARGGFRQ